MQIDEHFQFGKYKGLTLREVYQGTKLVDRGLVKMYIVEKVTHPNVQDIDLMQSINIEVSESLLRVKSDFINDSNFNLSRTIELLFRNSTSWVDEQIGNVSIDNFSTNCAKLTNTIPKVTSGNPEYLNWCISNIGGFYIDPDIIEELHSLPVFRIIGIEVDRKIEDIYEYKPHVKESKFTFSESIIAKNQKQFEAVVNKNNDCYTDFEDNRWEEDDDEYYCSACQQTPCMCSDPDPG